MKYILKLGLNTLSRCLLGSINAAGHIQPALALVKLFFKLIQLRPSGVRSRQVELQMSQPVILWRNLAVGSLQIGNFFFVGGIGIVLR